jgi:hypothetical protein
MIERFLEVILPYLSAVPLGGIVPIIQGLYLLALWFGARYYIDVICRISPGKIDAIFFLLLTAIILAFILVYPLADSGQLGFSSDRDEAIDIAVKQVLTGNYPYLCKAVSGIHDGCPNLGNPIAPLPGALLLASPFVMLGGSALQNIFWIAIFYIVLKRQLDDRRLPAVYLSAVLLFSPVLIAEILTGGDHLANSLAVTVAILLALGAVTVRGWVLSGILLGIALSWRAHFLLVAIPLMVYHLRFGKLRKFLYVGMAAVVGFVLITFPFWIINPAGFAPIHIQQRFNDFRHLLPHGDVVGIIFSALVGIGLGLWAKNREELLIACGATVIVPILLAVILHSFALGYLTFMFYGWYAITGLMLGTLGAIMQSNNCERSAH